MTRKIATTILMLGTLVLSGLTQAVEIDVTTTVDEDNVLYGGTDHGCSLREAVQAAAQKIGYGGCAAGSGTGDVIKLGAGPYNLTPTTLINNVASYGPIVISSGVTIEGQSTTDNSEVDLVTGTSPTRTAPTTVINMKSTSSLHSRVFLVTGSASATFEEVKITGGYADASAGHIDVVGPNNYHGNGGAIWAASSVSLANVQITNNQASGAGGAIFLTGSSTGLTMIYGGLLNNTAGVGGSAIGTTCYNSLSLESHTLTIQQSLILGNKTTTTSTPFAAIEACGNAVETVTDSTIAFNDIGISIANTGLATNNLAPSGVTISMTHDTVIGQSIAGIDVSNVTLSTFQLINSVVAFNYPYQVSHGSDVQDGIPVSTPAGGGHANCFGTLPTSSITVSLAGTLTGDYCSVTATGTAGAGHQNAALYDGNYSGTTVNPAWNHQFFMPYGSAGVYDPTDNPPLPYGGVTGVFFPKSAQVDSNAILVNGDTTGCDTVDQRGAPRDVGSIGCTVGAVEPKALIPQNDDGANASADGAARTVTVSVLANDQGDEDGSVIGTNLDGLRYSVSGISSFQCNYFGNGGVVTMSADRSELIYTPARAVSNGVLQPGQPTITNVPVTCQYWIYDSKTPSPNVSTLSAKVTMTVSDLAPIANNDSYTRPYSGDPFHFNPVDNDTDPDSVSGKLPASGPSRGNQTSALLPQDCAGRQLVNIATQPSLGTISGTVTARVISGSTLLTYYDGNLTYQTGNSYSPFSDSFTYTVMDADCVASNTATVVINVAAPPDGGKGGSPDGFLLLGGALLTGLRRRWRI